MRARLRPFLLGGLLVAACDPGSAPPGEDMPGESAVAPGKADGSESSTTRPPFVVLVDNSSAPIGGPGTSRTPPTLRSVGAAALEQALGQLAEDIEFADYPFSGCHDRAHVTYLHLARSLGSDAVAKVWVFGPAIMSVALDGGLTAPIDAQRWGLPTTSWDYHVAAVVLQGSEQLVIDPVLADVERPLTLDGWLDAITTPPGSVYTIIDGQQYSFNTTGPSEFSAGRMPFNGGMFRYDGFAKDARWLESNLARDAVAEALADDRRACPSLGGFLDDPQFLVDSLAWMATRSDNDAGCQPFVDLFVERRAAWTATVGGL